MGHLYVCVGDRFENNLLVGEGLFLFGSDGWKFSAQRGKVLTRDTIITMDANRPQKREVRHYDVLLEDDSVQHLYGLVDGIPPFSVPAWTRLCREFPDRCEAGGALLKKYYDIDRPTVPWWILKTIE